MDKKTQWAYTEKVKDHFMHPRNVLDNEENFQADGRGVVGNVRCGDEMVVLIKVDRDKQIITDCKWRTYGCASAIASTSVLSEMVIGMPVREAFAITPKDIMRALGELPAHKIHCSVLGDKALRCAIIDYYKRNNMTDALEDEKSRVICQCMNVTDREIEDAVNEGARTYTELQERTKIGTVCGKCNKKALALMEKLVKKIC